MLHFYFASIVVITLITSICSIKGFTDKFFEEKYIFNVDKILNFKQQYRTLTCGFLHANYPHLVLNMISLSMLGISFEYSIGSIQFLIIYFGSLLGGSYLSLYIHRFDHSYLSYGASGAVAGIVFGAIANNPNLMLVFPFPMPAYIYAITYGVFSIWKIIKNDDNIGHEAHLGGALTGLILTVIFNPTSLNENWILISFIFFPIFFFLVYIIKYPEVLLLGNWFKKNNSYETIDDKYNQTKVEKQIELDRLLDKINRKGINSLSEKERNRLDNLSK